MPPPSQAEILDRLSELSGLSPAVQAILPRLGDDDLEIGELSDMIGQDPVLTARVLRLANSPFYGLPRQVGSLSESTMILGLSNLRGLLLSSGLIGAFPDSAATARSLATGAAAGSLARSLRRDAGIAFTAGLLHNLGALLLQYFAPVDWRSLASEPGETMERRLERERQSFGFDHCALAAGIAGHWRFPTAVQTALRLHPLPPDDPVEPLADLVHAAWAITSACPGEAPNIAPAVSSRLGLATPDGQRAITEAMQAARASQGMLEAPG